MASVLTISSTHIAGYFARRTSSECSLSVGTVIMQFVVGTWVTVFPYRSLRHLRFLFRYWCSNQFPRPSLPRCAIMRVSNLTQSRSSTLIIFAKTLPLSVPLGTYMLYPGFPGIYLFRVSDFVLVCSDFNGVALARQYFYIFLKRVYPIIPISHPR